MIAASRRELLRKEAASRRGEHFFKLPRTKLITKPSNLSSIRGYEPE
jgi:hypothetical protein